MEAQRKRRGPHNCLKRVIRPANWLLWLVTLCLTPLFVSFCCNTRSPSHSDAWEISQFTGMDNYAERSTPVSKTGSFTTGYGARQTDVLDNGPPGFLGYDPYLGQPYGQNKSTGMYLVKPKRETETNRFAGLRLEDLQGGRSALLSFFFRVLL
jgi:hypothetical protein